MNILIVGNDIKSQILMKALGTAKHHVTMISGDRSFCEATADLTDRPAVCGDASHSDVLLMAGVRRCDLLIAMSGKDADNLVVCDLAKRKFGVSRTIAMVENPVNCAVFRRLGVDTVICAAEACSQMIENVIPVA